MYPFLGINFKNILRNSYSVTSLELKSFDSFNATPLLLSPWMKETEIRQNKINLDEMQIISSIQQTMKDSKWLSTMVVYMCSSLVHLTLESRDLSQTEKNITLAYKLSIFTNWQLFSLKMVKVFILNEQDSKWIQNCSINDFLGLNKFYSEWPKVCFSL